MGKKQEKQELVEQAESQKEKEILELPQKIGFGRDSFVVVETSETQVTYNKYGKGSDEVVFAISDIKGKDPKAEVALGDKSLIVTFSKPFDVRTYASPRKKATVSEREEKRLNELVDAFVETSFGEDEEPSEEEFSKRRAEFPQIVKYVTEDEKEQYYVKSDKEIWIAEENFTSTYLLLITLVEAYFKAKFGLERGTPDYLTKFEDVLYFVL